MNITNTHRNEYKRFVEIKRDDYVYLWHNILESHDIGQRVMSNEMLAIAEQRFNYWNRSIEDIMQSFTEHFEGLEITPMQSANKTHFDEYFEAKEKEAVESVSA